MSVATEPETKKAGKNPEIGRIMSSLDSVHFTWDDTKDTVMLIFGGMPLAHTEWVPFQFVQTTVDLPCSKIYLRDTNRSWYHFGLRPHTHAIDDTAAYLMEKILERSPKRIVNVGVSAGGYAAMLFGYLIGADETHAFAPQCYIDIDNRLKNNDFFMDHYLEPMYESPYTQKNYFDLKPLFESKANTTTKHFIHFARKQHIDVLNAEHLKGQPGVYFREYQDGGHQIARHLRTHGQLDVIFEDAIAGRTEAKDIVYDF